MPRDVVEIAHPEILKIVAGANIELIDGFIERMTNGDQGNHRSKYKSAIQFMLDEKTRYQLEAERAGIEIPEKDVLSKGESHTQTSIKENVTSFLQGFFLGAPFVAAMVFSACFFFAAIWGAS